MFIKKVYPLKTGPHKTKSAKTKFSKKNFRAGFKAAATSKMERFVIIINGFQPLAIITKRSVLDVATVLDSPLVLALNFKNH